MAAVCAELAGFLSSAKGLAVTVQTAFLTFGSGLDHPTEQVKLGRAAQNGFSRHVKDAELMARDAVKIHQQAADRLQCKGGFH